MFGVEPRERYTKENTQGFEEHASEQLKTSALEALKVALIFGINILCIVPFAAGQPLHKYWEYTKFLVITAMGIWVWLVIRVAMIWSAWQSAREVRREIREDLEDQ